MALVQETVIIGKKQKEFIHSYSDAGYYIHGGYPEDDYADAWDLASLGRTYVETDIPIEEEG